MKRQNVLGVVLARGGSRGLADKHLRLLLGRPVIEYTLDHAAAARTLTHLVVSSDSQALLSLARRRRFDAIERPASLATDDASVQDVMLHALHAVEQHGQPMDAVVVLYGNVAVRGSGVIDRAVDCWKKTACDSVRTFCPVGKWHPAWMSRLDGDRVSALQPGSIHRRQDLEPLHLHDGAVVVMSRASLLRGEAAPNDPHAMFGVDRRGIATAADETVEIDTLRDFYWAEASLRAQRMAA
ncbi:MAG TPA: NTP transferase domain-containing protein [Tepidisphaeraceae bacterium]